MCSGDDVYRGASKGGVFDGARRPRLEMQKGNTEKKTDNDDERCLFTRTRLDLSLRTGITGDSPASTPLRCVSLRVVVRFCFWLGSLTKTGPRLDENNLSFVGLLPGIIVLVKERDLGTRASLACSGAYEYDRAIVVFAGSVKKGDVTWRTQRSSVRVRGGPRRIHSSTAVAFPSKHKHVLFVLGLVYPRPSHLNRRTPK